MAIVKNSARPVLRPALLRSLTVILFCVWAAGLRAQDATPDTARWLRTLPVKAVSATADNLLNLYVITPENAVEKYAPDGRRLARYTNNRLGRASRLDASNPLKVLVWYADFRTAVFLDRSLTALGELNLIDAGYPEVRTVAAAQDGNLWIYDEVNFRLLKIDPGTTEGSKRYESQDLNLLQPAPARPAFLQEYNDRVYMADSTRGIFIFDLFAQFERLMVPLYPVKEFQAIDNQVHYIAGNKIVREHLAVRTDRETLLPDAATRGKTVMLSQGGVLILGKAGLEQYVYR